MQKRRLGTLEVSALGLGCMGMSEFYGPADEDRCLKTIQEAYENGITFFDTADMYGTGHNEQLLGRAIKEFRNKIVLSTKFGVVRKKEDPSFRKINGRPEYVKEACEASLKRLNTPFIDLYFQHRIDPETAIEDTVGAMADLVKAGKVRHIGLSEANEETIRRAHAVHPITALQTEYSLWSRDPEEGLLNVCQELHIGFVAYSPLGRGFLSGKIKSTQNLAPNDFRRTNPRFHGENFNYNLKIVAAVEEMARAKKCTPSQLALAWVLARSQTIVPIFGTTHPEHLQENIDSTHISLTSEELRKLNERIPPGFAKGERYSPATMQAYRFKEKILIQD